jgi:uncharacterized protein (TIGR02270 family)
MQFKERTPVLAVVRQHAEDAAVLRGMRSVLVRAPHVRLLQLGRLDERLAAHLDGLREGGPAAREMCVAALASPSPGAVFAATVLAIELRDAALLRQLLAVAEAEPAVCSGLTSALGWVQAASLRGITAELLASPHPFERDAGLAACALHQVAPGRVLDDALASVPSATAVRTVLALGRQQDLPAVLRALDASAATPWPHFVAARAALLLGDRGKAAAALTHLAQTPGPVQGFAVRMAASLLDAAGVHALLKPLSQDPTHARTLIRGIGGAGDPYYVPWLIKQMAEPRLARVAAEAFCMITGLDLAALDLDRKPPEGVEFGPNDDPADADVALEDDDGLPWPEVERIGAWWRAHGAGFQPGTRYFVGQAPTGAHCVHVLKTGSQRQRIAAAETLCLLAPGTPLFNVAAPTWRQERQLAHMGA